MTQPGVSHVAGSAGPAVSAPIWLLRSRLDWVLVYNREPRRIQGHWHVKGLIHPFSPRDARLLDFDAVLTEEIPREGLLSTAHPGRWFLTLTTVPARDVCLFFEGHFVYAFCQTFLRAARVEALPVGVPLYLSFPD